MAIKIIITGVTGFVGEGVLLECLNHPQVAEVLMVNRRHYYLSHPKLRELLVSDFLQSENYSAQLSGYDACFYCAGISSAGITEVEYNKITFDTTLAFAKAVLSENSHLTFCFVSGSHTDSTESGRVMWARVKGKTENALSTMPFKQVYHFRPGGMIPTDGQKNAKKGYRIAVKLISYIMPKKVSTMKEVGLAMINAALKGYHVPILEVSDIKELAK
jgi:uncharacterized protein YbjT (DUF2867 family)